MTSQYRCWFCRTSFSGTEEQCNRCGSGVVCPECGKCFCDSRGTDAYENNNNISVRNLFEKLVDEAENLSIAEEYDLEPIEKELVAGAMRESGMPGATAPSFVVANVEPEHFQSKQLQVIAEIVWPLIKANTALNLTAVMKLFSSKRSKELARDLFSLPYDAPVFPFYIKQVHKAAQSRNVLKALSPVVKKLLSGPANSDELTDLVLKVRNDLIVPVHHGIQVVSEREELLPFFHNLEENQQENDFLGLNMGFAHLNRVTNGLCTGVVVIAAHPSAGKTTLVKQIHSQVAFLNAVPVIYISYEQSKSELRIKDLSRLSTVVNRDILRGKHSREMESWGKVQEAAADIFKHSSHQFIVEADQRWDVSRIRAYAECIMGSLKTNKCLICVDYLQKVPISSTENIQNRRDEVSLVISDLVRMARDLDIPIIAISSESRAAYNKKSLDVFKESGEIEYSVDIAAVLHVNKERSKEYAEKYTLPHDKRRAVDMFVVKNRNGELAKISFDFYPQFSSFKETQIDLSYDYCEVIPEGGVK